MKSTEPGPQSSSRLWPIAVTVIVVVAILSLTGYLVFRSIARIPTAAVEHTREVLQAAQELAAAFRQGTIETRFVSYATSITGSTFLQIATVDRVEVFTREDRASIFWGALELPDVVVSATAPYSTPPTSTSMNPGICAWKIEPCMSPPPRSVSISQP